MVSEYSAAPPFANPLSSERLLSKACNHGNRMKKSERTAY